MAPDYGKTEPGDVVDRPAHARIVRLIASAEQGDGLAADALFDALYSELHRMAESQLARNGRGITLGTTTLLHEAYVNMSQRGSFSRHSFMAYAAKVMRGLIVDYARMRRARKRGGDFEFTVLNENLGADPVDDKVLSQLAAAVDELASIDPPLAELVDLKFFCGFSFVEIAEMRGVSERTVQRSWRKARIYLRSGMKPFDLQD